MLPIQDLAFNLNKREFCNVVKLPYEWPVGDITSFCVCGEVLTVDHSMICKLEGFVSLVTQRRKELRDLEPELLSTVCSDVEAEPVI